MTGIQPQPGYQSGRPTLAEGRPKLLDCLKGALRCSRRTEHTYCHWDKRFILFHSKRHPAEMAEPQINAFLTHLATEERVSASTQNHALSALLFLYRHVLNQSPKGVRNPMDQIRQGSYTDPHKPPRQE